ncbi:helix-turn-helix domain-containing protein [Embleya sp. AB8]|uniref:helix-turn-helix domain-containing protein n=1 Tax=Embleya sp. AB8 TaxID=3156304 RepID=UPI003C78475C
MVTEQTPTVRRRRLGESLRELRVQAGLRVEDAALRLQCHKAKISRIETGRSGVRTRDVRELLDLYGVLDPDTRLVLEAHARAGAQRGWWQDYGDAIPPPYADYIGLEAAATYIRVWQQSLVPGLLQTEDYTRAVHSALPAATTAPSKLETFLKVRAERQNILRLTPDVRFSAILWEPVIRTPVGGSDVMRKQLLHLLAAAERPNLTVQILPQREGANAGMSGAFVILGYPLPPDPDVVFLENLTSTLYVEQQHQTDHYTLVYDELRSSALSPEDSATVIREAVSEV